MGTFFANFNKGGANDVLPTIKWRVRNRCGATAVALGDLVCFDLTSSQSETTAGEGPGSITGLPVNDAVWLNVIDPTVPATILGNVYAVVSDLLDNAGADNSEIVVTVQGYVTAAVNGTNFTRNQALSPAATTTLRQLILLTDVAGLCRPVAYIATPVDASGGETTTVVAFFGWGGYVGGAQT